MHVFLSKNKTTKAKQTTNMSVERKNDIESNALKANVFGRTTRRMIRIVKVRLDGMRREKKN